jgi:fructose-1,6-bisphosphatase/inositol monophosphatase family enzyme
VLRQAQEGGGGLRLVGARGPDFAPAFRADPALGARLGEARWFGATAYELAAVASGALGYAALADVALWDCAGGVVLVAEAGGAVLTYAAAGRTWAPLVRFGAPGTPARALRGWPGPLLAGAPAAVAALARHPVPHPRGESPDGARGPDRPRRGGSA